MRISQDAVSDPKEAVMVIDHQACSQPPSTTL
jgi:hypothetical protein